jgi:hypothetical protein
MLRGLLQRVRRVNTAHEHEDERGHQIVLVEVLKLAVDLLVPNLQASDPLDLAAFRVCQIVRVEHMPIDVQ